MKTLSPSKQGTANLETRETVLFPSGILGKINGKTHENGGVNVDIEPGSKIYSEKILLPKQIVAEILGKKPSQVSKMSPAALSKKFDPQEHLDVLDNPDINQYAKNTALVNLNKKQGQLEVIFQAQEAFKKMNGIQDGKLMTNEQEKLVARNGGLYQSGALVGPGLPPYSYARPFNQNPYDVYADEYAQSPLRPQEGLFFDDEFGNKVRVGQEREFASSDIPMRFPTAQKISDGEVDVTYSYTPKRNVLYSPSRDLIKDPQGNPYSPENFENVNGSMLTKKSLNPRVQQEYDNQLGYSNGQYDPTKALQRRTHYVSSNQQGVLNSFDSTYVPVLIKDGKAIGKLQDKKLHSSLGDLPVTSFDNPADNSYDVQYWASDKFNQSRHPKADLKNTYRETGRNNDDLGEISSITQVPDTARFTYPTGNTPANNLGQVTSQTKRDIKFPHFDTPTQTTSDNFRFRELEELDKAQRRNLFDFFGRKKAVPFLEQNQLTPAYQRFTPMNTLAIERQQNYLNKTLQNSDASTQQGQAINADNYAKFLEGADKVQLANYQADIANDNRNNEIYMGTYNQNQANANQAMAKYVSQSQQVEDQYDKEGERIRDNMQQVSLNRARIYDQNDEQIALAKAMGLPYTPHQINKIGNKYYRGVSFDPNNRYNLNMPQSAILTGSQDLDQIRAITDPEEKKIALAEYWKARYNRK